HLRQPVTGQGRDGVAPGRAGARRVEAARPRQVEAAGREVGLLDRHVHHRALSTFRTVSPRVTPVLDVWCCLRTVDAACGHRWLTATSIRTSWGARVARSA